MATAVGAIWKRKHLRGTFTFTIGDSVNKRLDILHISLSHVCFSCFTLDFFRRQRSTLTALPVSSANEEVGLGRTSNDNPPPFNPNFNLTTGFPEVINHVESQPFIVPDYLSDGESDDSTGPSPSNRLLPPQETVESNANPGIYQGVEIDLSEFRRNESSISIEGSPGAQFSPINIDSDNEDEDNNVSFAIVVTKTN